MVVNPHDPAGGVQVRTKDSLEEELGAQDVLEANDDRSHLHNDDGNAAAWDPCQIRIGLRDLRSGPWPRSLPVAPGPCQGLVI